jgi:hypothetical protein
MRMNSTIPAFAVLVAVFLAIPVSVVGQQPDRWVSLLSGASWYDLDARGSGTKAAIRVDLPITPALRVEPGLGYLGYREGSGERVHQFLPEFQLQLQLPGERFRPYLGGGLGASWERGPEGDLTELAVSGGAGLRVLLTPDWRMSGEARFRGVGPWGGSMTDVVIGIGRRR